MIKNKIIIKTFLFSYRRPAIRILHIARVEIHRSPISRHERRAAGEPGALVSDAGGLPRAAAPHGAYLHPGAAQSAVGQRPVGQRLPPSLKPQVLLLLPFPQVAEVPRAVVPLHGAAPPLLPGAEPLDGGVEELHQAGDARHHAHAEVEHQKDGLLGGPGGEAVHRVRAGEAAARELGLQPEAVQPPLAHQHPHLGHQAEGHVHQVELPQAPLLRVLLAADGGGAIGGGGGGLDLREVVHGVHQVDQGRGGDEHDVEDPEPVHGDGEGMVIAHLLAARLQGVAGELFLLIVKQVRRHGAQDQNAEDEHEEEPEATQHGRVGLEVIK